MPTGLSAGQMTPGALHLHSPHVGSSNGTGHSIVHPQTPGNYGSIISSMGGHHQAFPSTSTTHHLVYPGNG